MQCFVSRGGSAADRWKDRASHAGQAVVFAALGVAAATVALGARPNGDRSAQTASRDVLSLSGGPLLLGLLAAGVVIGGNAALLARFAPAQAPTAGSALDVCARATPADVAKALGTRAADPRHVGAGADVPAAGACTWDFGGGSIVALWFTPGSLARGKVDSHGHAYYDSVVTGLEYAFKEAPAKIAGLGDEAAAAGFDGGGDAPQLVVRRGDDVLVLVAKGTDRASAERVARLLVR